MKKSLDTKKQGCYPFPRNEALPLMKTVTKFKPAAKPASALPKAKKEKAPITRDALVQARERLQEISEQSAALREEELQIRAWVADKLHPADEGSKTVTIHDIKVTIGRVLNRTIGRDEAHRLTEEHPEIALEVLTYRPEVKVSGYKAHTDIADEYIVTKPGPPSVKFA